MTMSAPGRRDDSIESEQKAAGAAEVGGPVEPAVPTAALSPYGDEAVSSAIPAGLARAPSGVVKPIEVEGLVRRYRDIVAVDNVDLVIEPGEIFGFLGPNGAGKTTFVRMLVTLLRPTQGRASVAGFDVVQDAAKVRRAIGVALQQAAVDLLMTGRDLLRLQAALQGLPRSLGERRGADLLEHLGLTAAAGRQVGTYSGGMRRRLDLALALLHRPQVLFLDEPTAGLDPTSRASLWDEVRRLNTEDGTTVFLTTQYLEEADRLADRVAIIDHGRIVRQGRPERLKAEVGSPMLTVAVSDPRDVEQVTRLLARFGRPVPAGVARAAVRLPGGAGALASVVRAIDDAGITLESMEVTSPSLDDVFIEATGRRLEGALDEASGVDAGDRSSGQDASARDVGPTGPTRR